MSKWYILGGAILAFVISWLVISIDEALLLLSYRDDVMKIKEEWKISYHRATGLNDDVNKLLLEWKLKEESGRQKYPVKTSP